MEAPKIVLRPQKGVVGAGSSTEIQKDIKVHMCEKNKRFLLNRYICVPLGRTEGKKCSPIDSGILGAYADIYRRLLVRKNPGGYFINFWPHRLSRSVHKAKNQWCLNSQKTKFYYESHR